MDLGVPPVELHVFHHFDALTVLSATGHDPRVLALDRKLDTILAKLVTLASQEITLKADIQASLDALAAKVTEIDTVVESNDALLNGLSAIIAGLQSTTTDPETLQRITDLSSAVEATRAKLAAAVVANTPAA